MGVKLELNVTKNETLIFEQLLSTNAKKNTLPWDLLIWGNDDWFFNHPWSSFLIYRTHNVWSTLSNDPVMDKLIEDMFSVGVDETNYDQTISNVMKHIYDNAYALFVPTPNKVFAVNKEVVFTPYKMAALPLWEIELTAQHPSIRQGAYPEALKQPVEIVQKNF